MMNEAEVKKILEETFGEMMSAPELRSAREKYAKLKIRQAQKQISTTKNLYRTAWEKLDGQSRFLTEEFEHCLVLVTGSGFGQRNLTVVELLFTADSLTATAWAKEGLISQKSAEKAIDGIFNTLELSK